MCQSADIGTHTATLENGQWIYKAKDDNQLLKPKASYRDPVHFPVQTDIEDEFKKQGKKMINKSIDQILKKILK